MKRIWLAMALVLSGCDTAKGGAVSLYRNSTTDYGMRIHFATFDAVEGVNYNLSNCQMAARLLNSNITALAKRNGVPRNPGLGYWCEVGKFRDKGAVPFSFREEYPTDAE
jgi:hypothetical protein